MQSINQAKFPNFEIRKCLHDPIKNINKFYTYLQYHFDSINAILKKINLIQFQWHSGPEINTLLHEMAIGLQIKFIFTNPMFKVFKYFLWYSINFTKHFH